MESMSSWAVPNCTRTTGKFAHAVIEAKEMLPDEELAPERLADASTMQRSRGTKNDVAGLKVKMSRMPCSELLLKSSSVGSLRKRLLRPPNFPSSCNACTQNQETRFKWAHAIEVYFGHASAWEFAECPRFSETGLVAAPQPFRSLWARASLKGNAMSEVSTAVVHANQGTPTPFKPNTMVA